MADVQLARCQIQPGMEERLRDWYAELHERIDEVEQTLEYEGVYTETAFIQEIGDISYLYVFMEMHPEQSEAATDDEKYQIDAEHHAVLQACLVGTEWEYLEDIGHYTNPALR